MAYYYDDESDYDYPRGRRRPSNHRRTSDRRSAFLGANLGEGLYRTRSQGRSPAPVVNVFNDVQADAYQRTSPSPSPPYQHRAPYPPSPDFAQRGRRDRLGDDLIINELEDLALENRRLRSRSRGRSDVGPNGASNYYQWELRQKEKELKEIERKREWEDEKKRFEQDYQLKKIEEQKERDRIIADHERKVREESEERKAEEKRIKDKIEKDKRDKEEKERREWAEFERRRAEKEAKEKEEKKAQEAEFERRMRERLAKQGLTQPQIDALVSEEKKGKTTTTTTTTQVDKWRSPKAPVYAKIHREYLSVDTLRYYEIPYEYDRLDPNYIIILREMDKYETEVLFEHTRRLRAGKLLLEPAKKERQLAFFRKKDRSTSRVRKLGVLEY